MTTKTTHHNETQIEADPALPTIVLTREFDAPPELVFRAYTEPQLAGQWLCPRGLTMHIDEFDARTGGSYRYRHVDADGSEYAFRGVFHEVRPHDRVVQTFAFEGMSDEVTLEKTTFEDLGGRTRVTTTSVVDTVEARDAMLATGMEAGIRDCYELLDELLAEIA